MVMHGHQIDPCYNEIGLCSQNMLDNIYFFSFVLNTIEKREIHVITKREKIFMLISYIFGISNSILKFEIWNDNL